MSPRATGLAVGALICNAFVWGVSWWPFRELQAMGLHPLWSTALIYFFSLACIAAWRPGSWRGFAQHPQLWWLAVAAGLTNVGFNWAVTVGDVVRVVLLFYLMPAWSVLLAWAMLGEKPTRASLLRLLLAMAGVFIVLKAPDSPWPVPQGIADWLALMGGLSFAATNVLLRKLEYTPSASRMLAMFGGGGVLASAAALLGLAGGIVSAPVWTTTWLPVAMALALAFLISNMALQYGAARLAASTTALVMLTEILFASLSAAALGAAEFSPRTLLGGSLIVLAALLAARK
ncbi:DMT family transporter [Polaromonas sp.]|uniref:DMT family transporter n=1 Tax=Polaromonas sp. TaxID=1869339 RepID=UPI0035692EED